MSATISRLERIRRSILTDTNPGRIFRLPAGASTAELYLQHPTLRGVDGITFLDGVLYVNNVIFNKLYRIPVDATGKPGTPVDIWIDQPIKGPDGMRAANGKLLLAENGGGKISALTLNGDKASVTVLKDGLNKPTGVEPAGDTIWIAERGAGKAVSIPILNSSDTSQRLGSINHRTQENRTCRGRNENVSHSEVAGYRGSKRFAAAATDNAPARITSKEVYEPVESNARPKMTGPVAPAAA